MDVSTTRLQHSDAIQHAVQQKKKLNQVQFLTHTWKENDICFFFCFFGLEQFFGLLLGQVHDIHNSTCYLTSCYILSCHARSHSLLPCHLVLYNHKILLCAPASGDALKEKPQSDLLLSHNIVRLLKIPPD